MNSVQFKLRGVDWFSVETYNVPPVGSPIEINWKLYKIVSSTSKWFARFSMEVENSMWQDVTFEVEEME